VTDVIYFNTSSHFEHSHTVNHYRYLLLRGRHKAHTIMESSEAYMFTLKTCDSHA